jgi:hypothetical protein
MAASPKPLTQPVSSVTDRLTLKLHTAWRELAECADAISQAFTEVQGAPNEPSNLEEIRGWYEESTRRLLVDPVQKCLLLQPLKRVLEAMRACDQETPPGVARARARTDARFLSLLILTALDLCEPWRIWRSGNDPRERDAWEQRRNDRSKEASALFHRYEQWAQHAKPGKNEAPPKKDVYDVWWRQLRALTATLEVETALRELTVVWFDAVQRYMNESQQEHEDLETYATETLVWLEQESQSAGPAGANFALVTPEERLRTWALPIEREAAQRLPERVELLAAERWRLRRRNVKVRAAFLKAFERYARTSMHAMVEHLWQRSAATLREVEQSKEIMVYWSESAPGRASDTLDLMAEARHNAIASLVGHLQAPPDITRLEAEAAGAFWQWQTKGSIAIEADLYGWVPLLERPRRRMFVDIASDASRLKAEASLHGAGRWASKRVDQVMESFGGRVPSQPSLPPVVRRTTLRDTLSLPAAKSDLPALYRLLFRVAPVEDRRFLVGRDQELAGLEQAVADWEAGRFAACLLIGARGSGKTSLLNCATREIFAHHQLVRAEFEERILTPTKLDGFLRRLLRLREGVDVESAIREERRVLILEEAERIFLRKVGGFAAARYLTHLIHRTASTTLWIIVMNDRSFRVLDAGTHLHRVFSYRINAMNVSRADLESAILERHRLSGLRLEFAPPPAGDPRVSRAKRWMGIEDAPQKLFFDSLFQQSEGIFRSALQLWLSSIERVQGETLRIRQPLDPAFRQFRSEFAQEDKFTLLVIQEHGSLTEHELSEVLCESRDHSRSRMERLAALGLVERDPDHPGLRVNPEAQRFVNSLLRGTNLT